MQIPEEEAEHGVANEEEEALSDDDYFAALEAQMDGMQVGTAADVLPEAGFVVTATGGMRALGAPEFAHLADDVILANAGHHDLEVDVDWLRQNANEELVSLSGIHTFQIGNRDIHVLSRGALVNIAGGSGHPVEIMDLTFAVQGLGAHHLINSALQPGVHILPKSVDDSIAAAKLRSLGIGLNQVREEQADDLVDWVKGLKF